MPENGELTRHLARKAELLRASAANRAVLCAEAAKLREVAEWVDLGVTLARKAKSVLGVVATILGGWRAPKAESPGFVTKLAKGFALAQSLTALWRNCCGTTRNPEDT